MEGKNIAQIITRLRKSTKTFPSTGFRTRRQNVRMQIVISPKPPSIQVNISLVYPPLFQGM
jgi:hypothetical protein